MRRPVMPTLRCGPKKVLERQRRTARHALSGGLSVSDRSWLCPASYRALWDLWCFQRCPSQSGRESGQTVGVQLPGETPCVSILLLHKCLFSVTQGSFQHLAPLSIGPEFNEPTTAVSICTPFSSIPPVASSPRLLARILSLIRWLVRLKLQFDWLRRNNMFP